MIDKDGFRANVGIVLVNREGKLFWGKRIKQDSWQFPQGGINENESLHQALYRELAEEVGLKALDVSIIAESKAWLAYKLPEQYIRRHQKPICVGQRQKWFLLRLETTDDQICLTKAEKPEFEEWRWVNYSYPIEQIIAFKRSVYQQVLQEFKGYLDLGD